MSGPTTMARLRGVRATLPPAEGRIADIVLADPRRVASLTITQLAVEAATSETSVLRLAHRLGHRGYPGLRIALAEAAAAHPDPAPRALADLAHDDSLDDIIDKVAHSAAAAVRDTARRLDRTSVIAAADALVKARRVDLFGVATSGVVALDLQLKLHRIGVMAHAWTDTHLALTSVSLLHPGDVALVVSHMGTTVEALEVLTTAKASGATGIAITNSERSPVAKAADLVLLTAGQEVNLRTAATASRIGALLAVDILFFAVAQHDLASASAAVADTRRAVSRHHRSR